MASLEGLLFFLLSQQRVCVCGHCLGEKSTFISSPDSYYEELDEFHHLSFTCPTMFPPPNFLLILHFWGALQTNPALNMAGLISFACPNVLD